MLKDISQVIPIFVIKPIYILVKCPKRVEKMKKENLSFRSFDTVDEASQAIES